MLKVDYHHYLASREWRLKRKEVIARAKGWCERCHSAQIANVHHRTYERLGHEDPDDLRGLCRPCHEYKSAERDDDPAEIVVRTLIKAGIRPDIHNRQIRWWVTLAKAPSGSHCLLTFTPDVYYSPGASQVFIIPVDDIFVCFWWDVERP